MDRAVRRGEVRWYRFASPDKRRPVVILTRNSILEYLGEVTVAPITSTVRDIPSEVALTREDGVPKDCASIWITSRLFRRARSEHSSRHSDPTDSGRFGTPCCSRWTSEADGERATVSLPAGTKLGPYEVLAPIGAGGMG